MRNQQDIEVMKRCHVIGMTVTGATMRANLLGKVYLMHCSNLSKEQGILRFRLQSHFAAFGNQARDKLLICFKKSGKTYLVSYLTSSVLIVSLAVW